MFPHVRRRPTNQTRLLTIKRNTPSMISTRAMLQLVQAETVKARPARSAMARTVAAFLLAALTVV